MRSTVTRTILAPARRLAGTSFSLLLLSSVALSAGCRDATHPAATATPDAPRRQLVTVGFDLVEVETGAYTTCGLTSSGKAYCWGHDVFGEIGNGVAGDNNELLPVAVAPPAGASIPLELTTISVGRSHVCAVAKGGRAYCWGNSERGQVGASEGGTDVKYTEPTAVVTSVLFTDISAGSDHTCGLAKSGRAYCWGSNFAGQLGMGAPGPALCGGTEPCILNPRAVAPPLGSAEPLTFIAISAGSSFTCGVAKGGQVFCWGRNANGQLGIGSDDTDLLQPMPIASALLFTAVSAGASHACALAKGGAVWCWGRNSFGEVGNGTTVQTSVPVAVVGGRTFTEVSAGLQFTDGNGEARTCALAKGGRVYCWGDNLGGRLGVGFESDIEPSPVEVAGGFTFTSITAGMIHGCGVTKASGAYCWGGNHEGQLGTGSFANFVAPVPVSAPVP
jgi:alpha-tubulin suppressor-like RCC1 family protein